MGSQVLKVLDETFGYVGGFLAMALAFLAMSLAFLGVLFVMSISFRMRRGYLAAEKSGYTSIGKLFIYTSKTQLEKTKNANNVRQKDRSHVAKTTF